MKISIICPLYKGEKYIRDLHESLITQVGIESFEITYILTESGDSSEVILNDINATYKKISANEFSHSLTREEAVLGVAGEVIVFITQDIIIEDKLWLYKLTIDIFNGKCEASFARQICKNKTIEKYIRMHNYPEVSRVVSKVDVKDIGIMAYFYSDAASAIKRDIFCELNGYDKKELITNEDMYIAYKVINAGYRIKYCAEAQVIHSHAYTVKSLFKRYFDQGVFLKQHSYISEVGANGSAMKLLNFVVKSAIKEKNFKVICTVIPNFAVRFIANFAGKRYNSLSDNIIMKLTSNKLYWIKGDEKCNIV